MASNKSVTIDHIRSFFSLNSEIIPLDLAPTVTGGLGINNLKEYPPPEAHKSRITHGVDYVKKEREKEKRLERERDLELSRASSAHGLNSLEELSTMLAEVPNVDDISAEETRELYSRFYKKQVRSPTILPINDYRQQILNLIKINRVVIIQGSTGCGKTTQVPQYILDECAENGQNCNIIVTQPRKIAAVSIARRVCNERKWTLGTIVGYKVGLEDRTSADTRLTYVTTGVLLQKLINERKITKYTHIVIDEVHERDQDTDFVLLVVKKLIMSNSPHVKVILMSATINTLLFANYFTLSRRGIPAPVIEIEGKVKEVTEYYIGELSSLAIRIPEFNKDLPCIPEQLYDLVVKLMYVFDKLDQGEADDDDEGGGATELNRGAVLIFLPGYEEIAAMTLKLKPAAVSRKFIIIPLHSSITMEEQSKVFDKPPQGFRKVIISTNIAESSITVPDIKYVIDFCLTKNLVCDPDTNYTCLKLEWASKSNCTQRKGRAGRVSMGRVYRLVPEEFYRKALAEFGKPEIQRTSLAQLVLHVKKINLGEPKHLLALALDPPEMYGIEHAILLLKEVGALTPTVDGEISTVDGDLTFIGRVMSRLPLDVRISKLIILGYMFGFLEDCIIIAASLSLKSFLAKSFHRVLDFYKSAISWADSSYSDCFAYLHAYQTWSEFSSQGQFHRPGGQKEDAWGRQNFIQIKRIKEVDLLVREIKSRLEQLNIVIYQTPRNRDKDLEDLLRKIIIAGAFFPNYYVQDEMDEKAALREISNGDIYSTVYVTGLPANHGVLYHNALQEMMSTCGYRPSIEFEGRKAYFHFSRRGMDAESDKIVSTIHPAVYFATKMRLMNHRLNLQVFSYHEAENKMQQLRNIQKSMQTSQKELASNRLIVQPASYNTVKTVDLPPVGQFTISIFITHVVNCGKFWAQYSDQDKSNLLVFIENTINVPGGQNLLPVPDDLMCGAFVLAPYVMGKGRTQYYRATVEEIRPDNSALVFYIDYGNTKYIFLESLRQIPYTIAPDVYDTPALAFECQLSQIKPSSLHSFQWSKNSCDWFKEITRNQTLNAKVYSVVQNVVRLELVGHDSRGNAYIINQELIKKQFGEYAEETLLSKENYELRMRHDEMMIHAPLDTDTRAFLITPQDLLGTENVTKTKSTVYLKGPYSPLEVTYSGMCYIDHFKSIRIEGDSVNSVSLNREPQDKNPQMLVASSVSLTQSKDSIILRGTTLMPKIKGLQSLLCLVFAPYVEFRTDPARKAYTGALCGLGFDPDTGEPLSPDHDIEVVFDTVIDYADITSINAIRLGMNLILKSQCDFAEMQKNELLGIQERIRTALINVIQKKRESQRLWNFPNGHCWGQVDSEFVLKSELEENSTATCPQIYTLHEGIILDRSFEQDLNEHLNYLMDIAQKRRPMEAEVYCRLCATTIHDYRMLMVHLDTSEHLSKEALLK